MPPFKTAYDPSTKSLIDLSTGRAISTGSYADTTKSINQPAPTTTISTPTPVVSASAAKDLITTQIKPTLDSANASLAQQQQAAKERSIALSQGQITDQASMDAFKKNQDSATTQQPTNPADQAATDVANTPEVNYKWAYQRDGTRVQIPINSTAQSYGMFDEKPIVAPKTGPSGAGIAEEVQLDDGTSFGKLGDGSFARFAGDGTFLGTISQDQFEQGKTNSNVYQRNQAQKSALEYQQKIDQIINGTYPLSPDQQAQIQSVKDTFQRLIDQQALANKNYEGGVAITQGLLGMSEYSPAIAQGTLKSAIDSGLSKVAELNTKLIDTVTKMNIAFRSDNMKMLEDAYNMYNDYANKRQEQLDKMAEAAATHEKEVREYNLEVSTYLSGVDAKKIDQEINREDLSLQEKKALLDDKYHYANLSEEKRHNLATELEAQRANALKAAELYGNPSGQDIPFASTIDTVKQFGSTNQQRQNIKNDLSAAAQRQDWKTFLTQIQNAAQSKIGTKQQGDILDARKEIAQLDQIGQLVQQYEQAGGNMGYLKGTFDQVMTRFGQLAVDPQFKDIANQMTRAFQQYRVIMTGAAFGAKESADYKSVYPGSDNTVDLALNKVQSAKRYLETNIDGVYKDVIGPGYENAKGLAKAQDMHAAIAQIPPNQAAVMASQEAKNAGIFDMVSKWTAEPWPDGTKKDGNDILYFTRQQIGF